MLQDIQVSGKKDTRSGFGDGIVEAGRKNNQVVVLTADLGGSLKVNLFIKVRIGSGNRLTRCREDSSVG